MDDSQAGGGGAVQSIDTRSCNDGAHYVRRRSQEMSAQQVETLQDEARVAMGRHIDRVVTLPDRALARMRAAMEHVTAAEAVEGDATPASADASAATPPQLLVE